MPRIVRALPGITAYPQHHVSRARPIRYVRVWLFVHMDNCFGVQMQQHYVRGDDSLTHVHGTHVMRILVYAPLCAWLHPRAHIHGTNITRVLVYTPLSAWLHSQTNVHGTKLCIR